VDKFQFKFDQTVEINGSPRSLCVSDDKKLAYYIDKEKYDLTTTIITGN
jgi:hypothetical protein